MAEPTPRNLGTIDDRSTRQETLQWLFAARRHTELGNFRLAQELLNACLEREPDNLIVADAWAMNWSPFARCTAARRAARWRRFVQHLRGATAARLLRRLLLDPSDATAARRLVEWLDRTSAPEVVWRIGGALVASDLRDIELVRRTARAAEACGQFADAARLWGLVESLDPNRSEARRHRERLERLVAERDAGGAADEEVAERAADWQRAETRQDEWLARLAGQAEQARADAQAEPCDATRETAERLERYYLEAATEIYRERARRYPHDRSVWYRWIELLYQARRWDAICRELHDAPLLPGDLRLLAWRAESRQRTRDFEGALADYIAYRDGCPDPPDHPDEARRQLQRGAELAQALGRGEEADAFRKRLGRIAERPITPRQSPPHPS